MVRGSRATVVVVGAVVALMLGCGPGLDSTSTPAVTKQPTPTPVTTRTATPIPTATPTGVTSGLDVLLIHTLARTGITATRTGSEASGPYGVPYVLLSLPKDGLLEVHEFQDPEQAEVAAGYVSSDGTTYSLPGQPALAITYINPPRHYRLGSNIVLYLGRDEATLESLTSLLGQPFAGHGAPEAPAYATVELPAPIDELSVEQIRGKYWLRITSGLPGGCARLHSISARRSGNSFHFAVLNTLPAPDSEIACTAIYSTVEKLHELGDDLVPGERYTVLVNRHKYEFTAGDATYPVRPVLAPVDSLEITTLDDGATYMATIVTGLKGSCSSISAVDVNRAGKVVSVSIWNLEPASSEVQCEDVYNTFEHSVGLGRAGDDLEICGSYSVNVNGGSERTFQATSPNVRCADPGGR